MPRFLACSGGGDRGVIQLGILLEMYRKCGKKCVAYDEMAGISVGGFTCAFLSQLTPDTFEKEIQRLISSFLNDSMCVVQPWVWGGPIVNFIDAVLYHSSMYNNEKLKKMIHEWYDPKKTIVPFRVGAYNKTLAQYESFSSSCHNMYTALLASSAIPVIFPEIQIGPYMYQDGGMRHMIPVLEIKDWIQRTKGPKHVDILVCFPIHDVNMFTKIAIPHLRFQMVNEATRMVSDLMLEQLQNDLFEISKMVGVPVSHLTRDSVCEVTKGDLTIRILSPNKGNYHSITTMNAKRNQELYLQGKSIVRRFLKF
tara:strand:+ start:1468 stop:2397 length:930 start_codon:yes stop_codon:yes gene_type:complete